MTNFSIDSLSLMSADLLASSQAPPGAEPITGEFKNILTTLLLGLTVGGDSQSGTSFTSQLTPVILGLIEQMMAQEQSEDSSPQPASLNAMPSGMPVAGRLTQTYHSGHQGLDFGAPVGTPVRATMGGKVVFAGWNDEGYGNLVIVENGPYRTLYAHLSSIPVTLGQVVQPGSVIGLSGNTGNSTGPHLHYEVRRNGQGIDPRSFSPS